MSFHNDNNNYNYLVCIPSEMRPKSISVCKYMNLEFKFTSTKRYVGIPPIVIVIVIVSHFMPLFFLKSGTLFFTFSGIIVSDGR